MTGFFLSWELWQQMTFVSVWNSRGPFFRLTGKNQALGCIIVIVFGLGLLRLWRANRLMRRLEQLDAEKQARRVDIRRCGIDAWRANDIPFGVRALRRGVEVQGIWISSTEFPDIIQAATPATLFAVTDATRRKGKSSCTASADNHQDRHTLNTSTQNGSSPPDSPQAKQHASAPIRFYSQCQTPLDPSNMLTSATAVLQPQSCINSNRHNPVPQPTPSTAASAGASKLSKPDLLWTLREGQEKQGLTCISADREALRMDEECNVLPEDLLGPRGNLRRREGEKNDERRSEDAENKTEGNISYLQTRLRKKPRLSDFHYLRRQQ